MAFEDKTMEKGYGCAISVLPVIMQTILDNAGVNTSDIIDKIKKTQHWTGFDANTEKFVDMYKAGIINPAKADRLAIEHAASVTDLFLTTDCIIVPLQIAELNIE